MSYRPAQQDEIVRAFHNALRDVRGRMYQYQDDGDYDSIKALTHDLKALADPLSPAPPDDTASR